MSVGHRQVKKCALRYLLLQDNKYIMNDAADALLMCDVSFLSQLQRIMPEVPSCRGVVVLTDRCGCFCGLSTGALVHAHFHRTHGASAVKAGLV